MKKALSVGIVIFLLIIIGSAIYFWGWIIFFINGKVTMPLCRSVYFNGYLGMPKTYTMASIEECVSIMAIKKDMPELCNQITSFENCYIGYAINKNHPEFCEKASNQTQKDWCYSNFQNN